MVGLPAATRRLETYTKGCLPWQFHHQRGVKTRYRTDIAAELPSIGPIQSERGLIPGLESLARACGRFTQPQESYTQGMLMC